MSAAEAVINVGVTVTFLRMERPPVDPAPVLPPGVEVRFERNIDVARYRFFYDTVGAEYLWWLRRSLDDAELAALLGDSRIGVWSLWRDGREAGFYELDSSSWPAVNLSYFGLMPDAVGHGLGHAFLRHAVDAVWRSGARAMTVNTCTADHPRALPNYRRVGFREVRRIVERWPVPVRLGLTIPPHLVLA